MEFFDVSQFKIVSMKRFSTINLKMDGAKYLDLPIKDGAAYLIDLLKVRYKSPSVFYNIVVKMDDSMDEEEFIMICENFVSAIFHSNRNDVLRTEADRKRILNKLPSGWSVRRCITDRINCDTATLLHVSENEWKNRNINIAINSADGHFKYQLIGPEQE